MKRIGTYIFTGIIGVLWSITVTIAQTPPDWSVDPAAYSNSMVMVGALNFDRTESTDENDLIAAFINGECRGVSKPVLEEDVNRFLAYLLIYANETEAEITFKLYDADTDQIKYVPKSVTFVVNGLTGELERPYIWSSVILQEEAILQSFSVPDQASGSISDDQQVKVSMRFGTDLSALIPVFEVSQGATVWVDGEQQVSGIHAHDFTQPITYTIRSEDEQTFTDYTIQVNTTESSIGETLKAVNAITPNNDGVNDNWVIRNLDDFDGFELFIYDNGGNLLYNSINYQNNWDGTYNSRPLPEGIYYYLFTKGDTQYRGIITILQ